MTEQKIHTRKLPLTDKALTIIIAVLLISGAVSEYIQLFILKLNTYDNQSLLNALQGSEAIMLYATTAIILKIAGYAAVPLISYLALKKYDRIASFKKLFCISAATAIILQIPYILLSSSKLSILSAITLSYIMLYFVRHNNKTVGIIVFMASAVWSMILNIENGIALLCSVFILNGIRNKTAAVLICSLAMVTACGFNMFYFLAPLSCVLLCFADDTHSPWYSQANLQNK